MVDFFMFRPKTDTARVIDKEDMYVVDSGGQYLYVNFTLILIFLVGMILLWTIQLSSDMICKNVPWSNVLISFLISSTTWGHKIPQKSSKLIGCSCYLFKLIPE